MDHAVKRVDCDMSLLEKNHDLKALITKCLTLDYKRRPSSKEIFNDKFFSGHTTIVQKVAAIKNFSMGPAPTTQTAATGRPTNIASDQARNNLPSDSSGIPDRSNLATRHTTQGTRMNLRVQQQQSSILNSR